MANIVQRTARLNSLIFLQSRNAPRAEIISKVLSPSSFALTQHRNSSFQSSQPVQDPKEYPEVEVIHNPPEWKFVERIIASPTVPQVTEKTAYPSGWTPAQKFDESKSPYYVPRTKNRMVPVYLEATHRSMRKLTLIKKVQGDIWQLEKELKNVVEAVRGGKTCASRVNEMSGQIRFHGDYVNPVRDYLLSKGF